MSLNICFNVGYSDLCKDEDNRIEHYKAVSTQDLIDIVEDGSFVDDVPAALCELQSRDYAKALSLAKEILVHKKGEEYLQSYIADFMLDYDYEVGFVYEFLEENDDVRIVRDRLMSDL